MHQLSEVKSVQELDVRPADVGLDFDVEIDVEPDIDVDVDEWLAEASQKAYRVPCQVPGHAFDDEPALTSTLARQRTDDTRQVSSRHRRCTRPQRWDDDWVDPADDLMYGIDK